ncbi:lipid kinase [Telmatospirillum sp. J64-1]|uniref:lipid kinase n=1 Tax=Telmatospirillum sp. J64-1 TaxID=2502183 RepID=UPI00115E484C|nr:lipid kinase [Telmatospirillum sp. J64-1]
MQTYDNGARRPKRALILVNRRARRGGSSITDALDLLAHAGVTLIEPEVMGREGLSEAIRTHAQEVDFVILGGGDGTMNAAAAGLHETGLPFGILPLGTANDLARTLGLPVSPIDAMRVILNGHTRRLDLGEVNGHFFFNVASIGFSAHLARNLTSEAKKRWGVLGYAVAASRLLAESRPFTVTIEHDGQIERAKTVQVSVGNGRFYGGGMTVENTAQPDDGRLDVYSLEVKHWSELLALLPALRRGTHGRWKNVRAFGTTEVILNTRRPHEVNADGELVTTTPAHFRIRRAAVTVFAPE